MVPFFYAHGNTVPNRQFHMYGPEKQAANLVDLLVKLSDNLAKLGWTSENKMDVLLL